MLQYEVAKQKYEKIKRKATKTSKEGFDEFCQGFLRETTGYANTHAFIKLN